MEEQEATSTPSFGLEDVKKNLIIGLSMVPSPNVGIVTLSLISMSSILSVFWNRFFIQNHLQTRVDLCFYSEKSSILLKSCRKFSRTFILINSMNC